MAKVLIPGSFDPLHLGHLDVVDQALELFGEVVVGGARQLRRSRPGCSAPDERVELADASLGRPHRRHGRGPSGASPCRPPPTSSADFIVKGLRNPADFDIEQQMAHMNHSVTGVQHRVRAVQRRSFGFVSSRFIREIAATVATIGHLVPHR